MIHDTLIQDLGWILLVAGGSAVVCHWLRIPVILGYLLAGILMGPNFSELSPIHEMGNIQSLAELGVIFLMFYLGLEFHIEKLKRVLVPSALALALQTTLMMFLGIQAGRWLGWSETEGIFLGGILSISSSMVTVAFLKRKGGGEGELHRPSAHLTVGVLILEDFLAILLLVTLTGMGVKGQVEWTALWQTVFFIGVFVVMVFVAGRLAARRVLKFLERIGEPEAVTLFTVGLVLGVSLLAMRFEFSLALGAFLAGAMVSRTSLSEEIGRLTEPLHDVFRALFFIAMGMLIVPSELINALPVILGITTLIVIGKFIACWLGFVLAGQKPAIATRASLPKIQAGEFGLIIAALGSRLGVTGGELKAVTVGIVFISVLLTPLLNSRTESWIRFFGQHTPRVLRDLALLYHNWVEVLHLGAARSMFLKILRRVAWRIGINFFLLSGVIVFGTILISQIPVSSTLEPWMRWLSGIFFIIPAGLCVPFFVDILRSLDVLALFISDAVLQRPAFYAVSRGIFRDGLVVLLRAVFFTLFSGVFLVVALVYLPSETTLVWFILGLIAFGILLWRRVVRFHHRLEGAVLRSMVDESRAALAESVETRLQKITGHNPWPVLVEEIVLSKKSRFIGAKIKELNLRNQTGATIMAIRRGGLCLYEDLPEAPLFPGDRLILFGERAQLDSARKHLNQPGESKRLSAPLHSLEKVLIPRDAEEIIGLALKEASLTQQYGVTVMGIQRGEEKITGPGAEETIEPEDILLVMGLPEDIKKFKESLAE